MLRETKQEAIKFPGITMFLSQMYSILLIAATFLQVYGQGYGLDEKNCGRVNVRSHRKGGRHRAQHITGGSRASVHWPWQVAIVDKSDVRLIVCGGSIITRKHILTAAHCIQKGINHLVVRAGARNLRVKPSGNDIIARIWSGLRMRNYNNRTKIDDVAVLELEQPLEYNEDVQPVCLTRQNANNFEDGKEIIVTGFGKLNYNTSVGSDYLMEVKLPKVNFDQCAEEYEEWITLQKDKMFCAGGKGTDSCEGDSGGPAVILREDGRYEQVGVVSFGLDCGRSFGVYASLYQHRSVIARYTEPSK